MRLWRGRDVPFVGVPGRGVSAGYVRRRDVGEWVEKEGVSAAVAVAVVPVAVAVVVAGSETTRVGAVGVHVGQNSSGAPECFPLLRCCPVRLLRLHRRRLGCSPASGSQTPKQRRGVCGGVGEHVEWEREQRQPHCAARARSCVCALLVVLFRLLSTQLNKLYGERSGSRFHDDRSSNRATERAYVF